MGVRVESESQKEIDFVLCDCARKKSTGENGVSKNKKESEKFKMRIKMIVAIEDIAYSKLVSDNISEVHADAIDISICNSIEIMTEMLSKRNYDVALVDAVFVGEMDMNAVNMPLLLWSESDCSADIPEDIELIRKHQRTSSLIAAVFEQYAKVSRPGRNMGFGNANITAVWSPAGGVGKTSVAIAYALSHVAAGKDVFYLNLEDFSSISGHLNVSGKSISSVFEMLDNQDGDINMLIQGINCNDRGITYLCGPDNFEDMSILSVENVKDLITACAELTSELIIDLPCVYDARTKKALEIAKRVLIVADRSVTSDLKLTQFVSQNNVFESVEKKVTFIANKDAIFNKPFAESVIRLPFVQSSDERLVCETLATVLAGDIF